MKKILIIAVIVMSVIGCRKQHVFHTFYGDIDIDTMKPVKRDGAPDYYVVHVERYNSLAEKSGLEWLVVAHFYAPEDNTYYCRVIDSDGNYGDGIMYDPYGEDSAEFRNYYHGE